jgi:uncharacterized membrane protein YcaP (DUF421 family)
VIRDGLMLSAGLQEVSMNREELFQCLRLQGIEHLGQVREAYVEQGGHVSIFCYPPHAERPGLRTIPPWDLAFPSRFACDQQVAQEKLLACEQCGSVRRFFAGQQLPGCNYCSSQTWVVAVSRPSPLQQPDGPG